MKSEMSILELVILDQEKDKQRWNANNSQNFFKTY